MEDSSEAFRRKTVLVTGGAGAIGSNLARALSAFDVKRVFVLDNLSSSYEWNLPRDPKIQFLKGDILNEKDLAHAFRGHPQIVYHLAAHFANQSSVDYPELDLQVNGLGVLKVLEHAKRDGVDRFVYASSGCGIYGADTPMPFTEDYVSMDLYTPYQVTKMLGELYTNMFQNLYDLPVVNARFFNSYGPGDAREVSECDPEFLLLGHAEKATSHHRDRRRDPRLYLRWRHRERPPRLRLHQQGSGRSDQLGNRTGD